MAFHDNQFLVCGNWLAFLLHGAQREDDATSWCGVEIELNGGDSRNRFGAPHRRPIEAGNTEPNWIVAAIDWRI